MANDDEEARKARAAKLRQTISRYTKHSDEEGSGAEPDASTGADLPGDSTDNPSPPMSPREFVQKRMHELEKEEEK